MPADLNQLNSNKQRIINAIQNGGPSFPTKVARETSIPPLFVAALMSELVAEKKLKISDMKIGSSPFYYTDGQEKELEKFIQYLNHKEREAFELLKKDSVISDSDQDPAIRVALRKIKDFAVPVNAIVDGQPRLFWRFFTTPELQAKETIATLLGETIKPEPKETIKEQPREIREIKETLKPKREEVKVIEKVEEIEIEKPKIKKQKVEESAFSIKLKDYLIAKDIELLSEITTKKKEITARVRLDTPLGKQEFYLIAKDKKKITEDELIVATQRAHQEKMPALIMAPGQVDKDAKPYLQEWRNLIKFEQVKF